MPRGKRKTCNDKLQEVQNAIIALEEQLKELKSQEKVLLKQKKEEELNQLLTIMNQRKLTTDDVVRLLGDEQQETA